MKAIYVSPSVEVVKFENEATMLVVSGIGIKTNATSLENTLTNNANQLDLNS